MNVRWKGLGAVQGTGKRTCVRVHVRMGQIRGSKEWPSKPQPGWRVVKHEMRHVTSRNV